MDNIYTINKSAICPCRWCPPPHFPVTETRPYARWFSICSSPIRWWPLRHHRMRYRSEAKDTMPCPNCSAVGNYVTNWFPATTYFDIGEDCDAWINKMYRIAKRGDAIGEPKHWKNDNSVTIIHEIKLIVAPRSSGICIASCCWLRWKTGIRSHSGYTIPFTARWYPNLFRS